MQLTKLATMPSLPWPPTAQVVSSATTSQPITRSTAHHVMLEPCPTEQQRRSALRVQQGQHRRQAPRPAQTATLATTSPRIAQTRALLAHGAHGAQVGRNCAKSAKTAPTPELARPRAKIVPVGRTLGLAGARAPSATAARGRTRAQPRAACARRARIQVPGQRPASNAIQASTQVKRAQLRASGARLRRARATGRARAQPSATRPPKVTS